MNIKHPQAAKYVESSIAYRDLTSMFLFEDSDDMHYFVTEVRDKLRLVVHAALVPNNSISQFVPPKPIEQLKYAFIVDTLLNGKYVL